MYSPVLAQNGTSDSLGLPGDNLNLYAVLDIFQKSETLEGFEKSLNTQNSKVNNLDLNNDNKIDYIRVVDNVKGTAHAIILQVAVNQKETQDVAVIEVEKDNDGNVQIQVVGDEMLYGKNYIIEPKQTLKSKSAETPNPGYTAGNSGSGQTTNITNNYYNDNTTYNNGAYYNPYNYWYPVSSWSIVRFIYYPSYVVYVSPWSWSYYPWYWNPWTPLFWHSYYYGWIHPYYNNYYGCYYRSYNIHNNIANTYYGQRRSTSASVSKKRESGEYNKTYSRPDLASKHINQSSKFSDNRSAQVKSAASQKDAVNTGKNTSSQNNFDSKTAEPMKQNASVSKHDGGALSKENQTGNYTSKPAPMSSSRSVPHNMSSPLNSSPMPGNNSSRSFGGSHSSGSSYSGGNHGGGGNRSGGSHSGGGRR